MSAPAIADQTTENRKATGAAGTLELGGRLLIVAQSTSEDEMLIWFELERQVRAKMRSPLQSIAEDAAKLPPALARMAIEAAVKEQASDMLEPNGNAILQQQYDPDGAAFRLWVLASKADPSLELGWIRSNIPHAKASLRVLAELGRIQGLVDKKKDETPSNSGEPGSENSTPETGTP